VPVECLQGPSTITRALTGAPAPVRLEGRIPISHCFQQAATAADVQNLGSLLIDAAGATAARVRAAPHSKAAVELGYLIGAVRRGARVDTGVHYEEERRIEAELQGAPVRTPEFRRGMAAGLRTG
jgi:hypothetical protein